MKTLFLMMALLAPLGAQAALPFPTVEPAKQQAKTEGKPALILWYGPQWQYDAPDIEAQWQQLAAAGLPVVIGQYTDDMGQKWDDRWRTVGFNPYNAPLGYLFAPDGTFMACYPRPVALSAEKTAAAVKAALEILPRFTELVAKARSEKGIPAATAAGQALELLALNDAYSQAELKKIITAQDPDNKTGYSDLFCTDHMAMYNRINKAMEGPDGKLRGGDRKFADGYALVNGVLATPHEMKPEQRQMWLCGLAYVYREEFRATGKPELRQKMLDTYAEVVKVDPASEYGIGAEGYIHYWAKPDAK